MSTRDGEARRVAGIRREGVSRREMRWRAAIATMDRIERLEAEARNGDSQAKGPAAAAVEPLSSPVR